MGATVYFFSDAKAATVIYAQGRRISVQLDKAIRTDSNGMSEMQEYRYERNPEGTVYRFTLRKNGRWVRVGDTMGDGLVLSLKGRYHYHDFSF